MVAHTRSLNPPIRKMREIISSGRLGPSHPGSYVALFTLALAAARAGGNQYRAGRRCLLSASAASGRYRPSIGRWSGRAVCALTPVAGRQRMTPREIIRRCLQFDGGVTATLIYDGYGYFDDRELIEGMFLAASNNFGPGQRLRKARAEGKLDQEHQPFRRGLRHRARRLAMRADETAPAVFWPYA